MSSMTAYDVIGEVRESLVIESLAWLDTTAPLVFVSKKESPLLRFMHSGWGVAVICAVVSLSVLGGIIWAGQRDPVTPTPPADTTQTEAVEDATRTETELQTQVVTEAETVPSEPADVWDGSVATSFGSGKGTVAEPYLITSAAELAYLAQSVNEGRSYKNSYLFLTSNIDLNHLEFTPIGTLSKPFSGVFDGQGHTISGLSVTTVTAEKDAEYISYSVAGLFGHVKNGMLTNIHLNAPKINLQSPVPGQVAAGLLCGHYTVYAPASDALGSGYKNPCEISRCLVTGGEINIAEAVGVYTGGILGFLSPDGRPRPVTLSQLESHVTINIAKATYSHAGGIAGCLHSPNYLPNTTLLELRDFCCYADIASTVSTPQYVGAIGVLVSNSAQTKIVVKNGHSELRFAGDIQAPEGYNDNDKTRAYVIANASSNYVFENLSGSLTAENRVSNQARWSESVSDILPAFPNEGTLDEYVWDLSDPQKPALIFP